MLHTRPRTSPVAAEELTPARSKAVARALRACAMVSSSGTGCCVGSSCCDWLTCEAPGAGTGKMWSALSVGVLGFGGTTPQEPSADVFDGLAVGAADGAAALLTARRRLGEDGESGAGGESRRRRFGEGGDAGAGNAGAGKAGAGRGSSAAGVAEEAAAEESEATALRARASIAICATALARSSSFAFACAQTEVETASKTAYGT